MQKFFYNHFSEYIKKIQQNKTDCFSKGTLDFYKIFSLICSVNFNKDTMIIVSNDQEAEQIYNFAKSLKLENIFYFPSMQIDPFENTSPKKSILNARINILNNLYLNQKNPKVLITSIAGFMRKTLPKEYLTDKFLDLKLGYTISRLDLEAYLLNNNYKKVSSVSEDGCFAIRGDIIDIGILDKCYRIDFFDDLIERIRIFDSYSQKTLQDIDSLTLCATSEIIVNESTIKNFKYYSLLYLNYINQEYVDLLENKILPRGCENYLSLFYDKVDSIISYMNNPTIIDLCNENDYKNFYNSYQDSYDYIFKSSKILKQDVYILDVDKLLISVDEVNNLKSINKLVNFVVYSEINQQNEEINLELPMLDIIKIKQSKTNIYEVLYDYIEQNKNKSIVMFTNTDEFQDKLIHKLKFHNIPYATSINECNDDIRILILNTYVINKGFVFNNLIILNEEEITGIKKTFNNIKSKNKILENLSSFALDDILAHNKHGFGIYKGIKTLVINQLEHDFLELLYKDNEKLYIPVENIDTLSRYSGYSSEVILDKLGSTAFENKQNKIKDKIKDIAYDLIKIAANRNLKKSVQLNINNDDYQNFCKDFLYVETQDQLNAINDILNDFLSEVPSDRLICGDVGFGKTEVAMRSAFLIANSGYQVIIITPTTLLCNQHYINFTKRFQNFPINIKQLSRFVSTSEKKQIKEDLSNGKIDILIATHSILAKDIQIKKLGLIIIDEEQSFGVIHKEKLKTFNEQAHLLTLSATPIPRTIQQAFKGIKDLSLITTPPINKLSINTYILPFDILTIKLAIDKEIQRGGQIFIVCPKISDIDEIQIILNKIYKNLSVVIAHGQMSTNNLENAMLDFQNKKYDILLSTSIIESGLDLKNVNTIIINNADLFGLAQLYQIRGRVGRGENQAYAYLLYNNSKVLTPNASKRLNILQNLDYLGASFALASYDLEIRGSGNLLGEEQSGHIKEIGYDLYQKLLEQEINNIKNNNTDSLEYTNFSPSINLNAPVLIPKNYISDIETSMEMYQKLGKIKDVSQIDEYKNEMIDRFGNLPFQVINLFESIELKILSKKVYVDKITFGNKGILYEFFNGVFPKVDKLLTYIEEKKGLISIKPQGAIMLNSLNSDIAEQIKNAKKILQDLNNILYN